MFCFRKNVFERTWKRIMTIDDKIRDEKLQYDINREAAKLSALLPPGERRVTEQAKFTYSPLGEALEKQTKTIENLVKKQLNAIKDHGKQLIESNECIKKDFNIDRYSTPHE